MSGDRPALATTLLWLLDRRRALLTGVVIGGVVLLAVRLVQGAEYNATSQFRPQGNGRSPLAGLAEQFGINLSVLGEAAQEESPFFYARLLATHDLLQRAAATNYQFVVGQRGDDTARGTVIDLYGLSAGTPIDLDRKVYNFMTRRVFITVDARADVITVRTVARWPELAVQLNRRLLDLLNEYNSKTRQSRARAERQFVEQRLTDARAELAAAEDTLQRFLERNVRYQESPELVLRATRLQQGVQLQQQVVTTLTRSLEEARIDEVRDTPVITVVDSPERAVVESNGPVGAALLGGVLGFLAALALAGFSDLLRRQRNAFPNEYAALRSAAQGVLTVFRRGPSRS